MLDFRIFIYIRTDGAVDFKEFSSLKSTAPSVLIKTKIRKSSIPSVLINFIFHVKKCSKSISKQLFKHLKTNTLDGLLGFHFKKTQNVDHRGRRYHIYIYSHAYLP